MLWLAVLLLVAWVLGYAVFHIAGGLIHLLLILAVVVFIYRLVTGHRVI
ncbi:MAG: lmo0937 family membrane protein [Gemmatimonadales bacterium]